MNTDLAELPQTQPRINCATCPELFDQKSADHETPRYCSTYPTAGRKAFLPELCLIKSHECSPQPFVSLTLR